ncbi:MAG: Gldg family protein [Bacteroidia bacterium]
MRSLLRKEIASFLSSLVAYGVWAVFLVGPGLFMWVFSGNVLQSGAAEMDIFFSLAPIFLLFLIPAITMRSLAEEFRLGTYEFLVTKPLGLKKLILAKYLAATLISVFALVPTLVFYFSLMYLAEPVGRLDHGVIWGAYVGLVGMSAFLVAIGLWASSLTDNVILAFLWGALMGFVFLLGWGYASELPVGPALRIVLAQLSAMEHYRSISRGVMDTRDILYFVAGIGFFLSWTYQRLASFRSRRKFVWQAGVISLFLVAANVAGQEFFWRWDITPDKRYTLSKATRSLLGALSQPLRVIVYLKGDFPYPIERLRRSVEAFLQEARAYSGAGLDYTFIGPSGNKPLLEKFQKLGLEPIPVNVRVSQTETRRQYIFPYAEVQMGNQSLWIDLTRGSVTPTGQINLLEAEAELEYKWASALRQLITYHDKPILAFLEGNQEYPKSFLRPWIAELEKFYRVISVRLKDGQSLAPSKSVLPDTLKKLPGEGISVLVIVGPDTAFTEREKYELEQYLLRGGRILWLIDAQRINLSQNTTLTQLRNLNVDDLLFRWGIRLNYDLVQDVSCGTIEVIKGFYNGPIWGAEKWMYFPIAYLYASHPVTRGVDATLWRYASSVDTLPRKRIRHTPLVWSSPLSRSIKGTQVIDLNLALSEPPPIEAFKGKGYRLLGVLSEGYFTSLYEDMPAPTDRFAPQPPTARFLPRSAIEGKVIVFSDAELALPLQVQGQYGEYLPLDNLTLLSNAIDYLAGSTVLTQVKTRKIAVYRLSKAKVQPYVGWIQAVNLVLPTILMGVMGMVGQILRRRRYT